MIAPGTQPDVTASLRILSRVVHALNLPKGTEASLTAKLNKAADALGRGDEQAAAGMLTAFSNEVAAQVGKKIAASDAASLTGLVTRLISAI